MRTILSLLGTCILLVACSGPDVYQKEITVTGYDFTEYTEQGFLFTPESYEGAYESIGVLDITVWPRVEKAEIEEEGNFQGDEERVEWRVTDDVTTADVIDSLHTRASEMGADAVVNFRTEVVREDLGPTTRLGVRARGFAIDRADK